MADHEVTGEVLSTEHSCALDVPGAFALVVFGASGDLTRRKIIPAVFRLFINSLLPERFLVLGAARTEMSDEEFREQMLESVREELGSGFDEGVWPAFQKRLHYITIDYIDAASYGPLAKRLVPLEEQFHTRGNRIFYLAVPPTVYEDAIGNLGEVGLAKEEKGYTHLVIEKPFGHDLDSAEHLNGVIQKSFHETQIYRMDHYLAKETVQNILMFRFANSIFEPLWNQRYIDHVQITVSETLGVERRAGYYEKAGVLRDMFQNHILQLLALTAMEPPSVFSAERVRDEKVKVFRSIRPFDPTRLDELVALGQYTAGEIKGRAVPGYRHEEGVDPASMTPTYAALMVLVDNWRWKGVPFYLRSGKRLAKRKAEISIRFRGVPHIMFKSYMPEEIEPNDLVLRVQPDEGIEIIFQTKRPGSRVCLDPVRMDFSYPKAFALEAYERVLLDCMQGDQMLFVRDDGVREAWRLITPLTRMVEADPRRFLFMYPAGSQGPREAGAIPGRERHQWRPL
jgi:glucose-6-phosphate 1-dehydrogenase